LAEQVAAQATVLSQHARLIQHASGVLRATTPIQQCQAGLEVLYV
jgi:hypothetical protein